MKRITPRKKKRKSSVKEMREKGAYVCKSCGYVLAKKDAVVSGYDSQSSLRHVHCPGCGKIITHNP